MNNFEIKLNSKVQEIETTLKVLKKYFDNVNVIKENKKDE